MTARFRVDNRFPRLLGQEYSLRNLMSSSLLAALAGMAPAVGAWNEALLTRICIDRSGLPNDSKAASEIATRSHLAVGEFSPLLVAVLAVQRD